MDRKSFLQKMGLASGAAALFGLAHTAPVRAAVLDNTKVQATDVTYQDTNVDTSLTQLNNSLQNIDVRYTTENGAQWRERGADTWRPFSGGKPHPISFQYIPTSSYSGDVLYTDKDSIKNQHYRAGTTPGTAISTFKDCYMFNDSVTPQTYCHICTYRHSGTLYSRTGVYEVSEGDTIRWEFNSNGNNLMIFYPN